MEAHMHKRNSTPGRSLAQIDTVELMAQSLPDRTIESLF
jgi:hypothetical protein